MASQAKADPRKGDLHLAKIIPIATFQHFLAEMKESFWGDLYGQTPAGATFSSCSRSGNGTGFPAGGGMNAGGETDGFTRDGYYERDFVTRFGTIRLRIAHTRGKTFAGGTEAISAAGGGGFVVDPGTSFSARDQHAAGGSGGGETITGETVSAQTVSKLTRDLDEAVRQFHQARLSDDYVSVSGRGEVRRPAGACRCWWPMGSGGMAAGTCWPFCASQGESQADWEDLEGALLPPRGRPSARPDSHQPDVGWRHAPFYSQDQHQRCWVHKMRNILEKTRKRDYDEVKTGAQAIYVAKPGAKQ